VTNAAQVAFPIGETAPKQRQKDDSVVVVQLEEYTTVSNRQELVDRVMAEFQRGARDFVLDLAHTVYLDAAALNTLVGLAKRVREQGGELRLVNPNDDLRLLLDVIKLTAFFKLGDPEATPRA
jgi:anti-anti-sigma factor